MKQPRQDWEIYERNDCPSWSPTSPAPIFALHRTRGSPGKFSGISRQIDVLIDARHDIDNSRRIIVDAKRRKRKIDVTDVESLLGGNEDVGATHGYLVSPSGHTKAAEKRAQMSVSISIVPVDRLTNFDPSAWPECRNTKCKRGRVFWDGYPELSLLLHPTKESGDARADARPVRAPRRKVATDAGSSTYGAHAVDQTLPIPHDSDDDGHQCGCKPPWFWLASIEEDEEGARSAALHVAMRPAR